MTSFFRRHRQGGFIALMVLAMTSWGGSWTSAKLIANAEPPEVLVFWRFLATVLSFVPVLLVTRASLRLDRRSLGGVVLGGKVAHALAAQLARELDAQSPRLGSQEHLGTHPIRTPHQHGVPVIAA